ncbi:MAG TPA: pyrroloquinoline quinone biosynthesis protein PqqE [Candidatus Acidoferrum sp.]|jgi:pyrroloquinoline quinone biosynthesis protein E|nr:pyrroloquinoline quinone biosynthesis protein PqqE [Candidatus Acidoferrum sp.]
MTESPRPYTLVAELTYRCPLRCVYCSNPVDWASHGDGLETADWLRIFREAEELGVVQLNLTGGEPLLRRDLETLVEGARGLDLYTNLITSGIPLTRERLAELKARGLDNVQVSIQDVAAPASDRIAGLKSFERKLEVAHWVKELGLPLTLNTVLHRDNLDRVGDVVALAESLAADRLELANTQYLGWALLNRAALLPTREQLDRARDVARAARGRLQGRMEVLFVTPDYYVDFPKSCMDGWGRRFIVVAPDGLVLPCHAAHTLPGLVFDNAKDRPLAEIWQTSSAFNAFRGEAWMPEPCRSCDRRALDFGGCRCQAFQLTGDAAVTDPVCSLAPDHGLIAGARRAALAPASRPLEYRAANPAPR